MANVNLLLAAVKAPTGLWPTILNWIENTVVNYGWVIILFTLLVKVCLTPLDFLVRFSSKKQTLIQQKLAPQIGRINRKYQNDPNQARQQTSMLYKREGLNGGLSCLIMIINLAVTMTVFFTLYASLRDMSAYKALNQYVQLETAYTSEYNNHIGEVKADFETRFKNMIAQGHDTLYQWVEPAEGEDEGHFVVRYESITYEGFADILEDKTIVGDEGSTTTPGLLTNFCGLTTSLTESQAEFAGLYFNNDVENMGQNITVLQLLTESGRVATEPAAKAASERWKEVKDSWLWIQNIWVADSYKSPVPNYNDLQTLAKNSRLKEHKTFAAEIDKDLCAVVTSAVHNDNKGWNGYFILAVLAGVTSFLSQWITEKMSKPKNKQVSQYVDQANPTGGMMKFMKILLPALMVIFVLTSSASFGIYIVVSSLISMLFSTLITLIVDACFKKKQAEIYEYLEKETMKSLKKSKRS